ncbi:MAG: rhodanese-like domain-containing protein, partial [Thiohalophilus sp.]
MFRQVFIFALLGLLVIPAARANDEGFPGRAEYPAISVIEQSELLDRLEEVVIVDARSSLEFDTLRITGAVNIPVAAKSFEEEIQALRNSTDKPIVFYCNGRTCMKSYLAAEKAAAVGVTETYAYDAGMFE